MSYSFQKIALFFQVPILWIASNFMLWGFTNSPNASKAYGVFVICFLFGSLLIAVILGARSWKRISRFQKETYDWYVKNHPELIKNGRVSCKKCSGGIIHTRNLFKRTFTREHFCTQCGTTLYYSPES